MLWCGISYISFNNSFLKLVKSNFLMPKNTGVGSLSLQGILLTQESNQGLLHCRQILYQLSYQGTPPYGPLKTKYISLKHLQILICLCFFSSYRISTSLSFLRPV